MKQCRLSAWMRACGFLLSLLVGGCDGTPQPTPYTLTLPPKFPEMPLPADNPMTMEGVALGEKLFSDPLLSSDGLVSCASCHQQPAAFSDPNTLSTGVLGRKGTRQSMPLMNVGWTPNLFWDGRSASLEEQAGFPITSHFEMNSTWPELLARLSASEAYKKAFAAAFGTKDITEARVRQALAQYQRTLISANSKYDRWLAGTYTFTPEEQQGYDLFFTEKGDCFHCHGSLLMTDNRFHNNGLDDAPADSGRYLITRNRDDIGLFRSPTLRNIAYTAPYMHDGRFKTLTEVVNHYNNGILRSPTLDPLMFNGRPRGLTDAQRNALIAFLHTLSDPDFVRPKTGQRVR